MKKVSLLLVVGLLFLPLMAQADQVLAFSHAGTEIAVCANLYGGTASCTGATQTIAIAPHPAWDGPIGISEWVSYANTGDPNGPSYQIPVNGTFILVRDYFTVPVGVTMVHFDVLADDTAGVYVGPFAFPPAWAQGKPNTYATCSDVAIGCLYSTEGSFNVGNLTPGQTYSVLFETDQINGSSFGLDYQVTAVPEPASLTMLGAGFAGLVGVIRRKLYR